MPEPPEAPFLRNVLVMAEKIPNPGIYPVDLPAVRALDGLKLAPVTFFVGENGSGKSTIIEAIAVAAGRDAEGGTRNFNFATRRSESDLHRCLRLTRPRHPQMAFFLRAESFFNVAPRWSVWA